MSVDPIVTTEWLERHIEDPDIRIIDATTQLKHAQGDGYYELEPGRAAFDRGHIKGAVFADRLAEFSDGSAKHPLTVPSSDQFQREIRKLGVSADTHVIVYDQMGGLLISTET